MAFDMNLADRIRNVLKQEEGLTEKKMFGGLAFLINGNMTIAVSAQGGILVRINPSHSKEILESTSAKMMEMRGRSMPGWVRVSSEYIQDDSSLSKWIERALIYAHSLPSK